MEGFITIGLGFGFFMILLAAAHIIDTVLEILKAKNKE